MLEETFQKLDACIHCGMCLPACPTYRVTGSEAESPRGRLYLMRAFYEDKLESTQQLSDHLDPCLGCMACVTACPSGVQYDVLLDHSRQVLKPFQPWWKRTIRRFFLKDILPSPRRLAWLAQALQLLKITGLHRLLPAGEFLPTLQNAEPIAFNQTFGTPEKGTVALFTGCIMNAAYAQVHQATIKVLVANGYQVTVPPQTCCGALALHAGETDIIEALAEENIFRLLRYDPDWIVVNAAGCGSTLKQYDAPQFRSRVVDILELLARHPLEGPLQSVPVTATYHAACHLHHAQKVYQEPYALLHQIPDLQLIPLTEADICCGSAGVYNIAHPGLSMAILKEKMRHVLKTEANVVLAANPGCMLQLETGIRKTHSPMQVLHPIELIARAYPN